MPEARKPPPAQRLLTAARELFYAEGYEVSIDKITEKASVAKPTVYAHFASKEALIGAVLDASSTDFFDQLEAELARHADDPFAQLVAPFDLLVADLPDPAYHGCICVNAAATFVDPAHPAHEILRDLDDRMLTIFTKLAGQAGAKHPARLARQLLLLFDGIKTRGLVDNTGAAAADAREAAKVLLDSAHR